MLISSLKTYDISIFDKLEGISLALTSCNQLTSSGIKTTLSELISLSQQIASFELNVSECSSVNDDVIKELSIKIGRLSQLRSLNLYFNECDEISDDSIKLMSQNICSLAQLKEFKLNLDICTKVTTASLQGLMSSIGNHFRGLEVLELFFNGCNGITDQDINALSAHFVNFEHLRQLSLILSYCSKITSTTIKDLSQKIAMDLKGLQHLEIGLHGIDISNARQEIHNNLKRIPCLYLYEE